MTSTIASLMAGLLIGAASCAQESAAPAAAPPATQPTTQPATAPAVDPAVRKILDQLEQAGEEYSSITADLDYQVDDRMTGDTEVRAGAVKYKKETAKTPAKFYVRFDTLKQGQGKTFREKLEYGFDGQYLTVARHRLKQMIRYQAAAKGEKIDPFRLGRGPFPLPFRQKADDLIKYFAVENRRLGEKDPKNADRIRLTTRKEYKEEINFLTLEMWVDRDSHLPVKIRTTDKDEKTRTVNFSKIKTDVKLADTVFHMKRPGLDWEYHVRTLEEGKVPTP
ncbi:MAG TPA: outer membrane lipoprotein carrier protein LolA [Phycisphaerae bacterium]|nr:outer membrane lipoprotein carrier protein LolA [Phycisphaerae bacterium]